MSRIDDELEQAVRDAEDGAEPNPTGAAQARPAASAAPLAGSAGRRPMELGGTDASDGEAPKRSWGLLAGLVALMGGVLALVFNGNDNAVVYSYTVDDLKAQAADLGERQVRVQGILVYGTLVKRDSPCEYRFMMQKAGAKGSEPLQVVYPQCIVPDTFREVKGVDVEVTAEGRLAKEGGHLEATKIFAKCPSKYEMKEGAAEIGKAPDHNGSPPKSSEFAMPQVDGIASAVR
jgi:cytochrome c-type biogenesis protein CcmE